MERAPRPHHAGLIEGANISQDEPGWRNSDHGKSTLAGSPQAKRSQAQILIALTDSEEIFCATDGETAFATIGANGHHETWPVRSKGFRRWLIRRFYELERRPPGAQALQDALGTIEARAQFAGPVHHVHVRLAAHERAIYLDLANPEWEAVEVTAEGWRIMDKAPVKFRRSKGMLCLPHPVPGGSLDELCSFANVREGDQSALLVAWLVAAVRPVGPYPVLVLGGEHGTAKSTTAEVLRRLIDPSSAMLRAEPRDVRDVMIAATNGWMVALDNVSSIPPWLSDSLCRLATGGGFSTRELYSDQDETIFDAQRPAILNGIEEIVTRPDLLDRAILLDLPPIPEARRRPAGEFWREFEAARPRLLGALLDAVSTALRRAPAVRIARLPRMADFAIWATAAAPALGWAEDHFLAMYTANREQAHDLALAASPVADVIRTLSERGAWSGTAAELLETLNGLAPEATRRSKSWPATARALGAALRWIGPNLRSVGVAVDFLNRPELGVRRRHITIALKKDTPDDRSLRSARSLAGPDETIAYQPSFHENDNRGPENDARSDNRPLRARQNDRNAKNDEIPTQSNDPDEAAL